MAPGRPPGERRRRRAEIFDNSTTEPLDDDAAGMAGLGHVSDGWIATADPDIIKRVVLTGTPGATQDGATAVSVDFPPGGFDSWYKPTAAAYTAGRAQAALDTIEATTGQLADLGAGLIKNFWPIALGLVALFFYVQHSEKRGD